MQITKKGEIICLDGFDVRIDKKVVLQLLDCKEDNPIYEEVEEEYEELEELVYGKIESHALIKFDTVPEEIAKQADLTEQQAAYVLTTVGGEVSAYSTEMFRQGDYLRGMLIDAMADSYLFQMEDALKDVLREECASRKAGIKKRLEAPHDIPMEMQQVMHRQIRAEELLGIGITSGFMFDPVKTSCLILILTDDEKEFRMQHDCRKCSAVHCKLRKVAPVMIEVIENGKSYRIPCAEKQSILDALIAHDVYFSAVCGGKGICGKCKIRLLEGSLFITPSDEKKFTKEELDMGYRLSCRAFPDGDCKIALDRNDESDFEIVSDYTGKQYDSGALKDTAFGIAIDIGTTTIALNLVGKQSREVVHSFSTINKQRSFGADVISRIQASNDGKKEELQASIRQDLLTGIREILKETGIVSGQVEQVVIGCNTTMGHLLMGYSCETLGVVPFTPVNIKMIKEPFEHILGEGLLDCEVVVLPGISTYVGGDIVSGMYFCDFFKREEICLLVDLGTNGEMALGNKDKILVSSTAAGPAFEGGNITWGMGSVKGAICGVHLNKERAEVETIGNEPPIGLCGTGVIETAAELVREEFVDETGLLDEDYFDDGFPIARTPDGKDIVFTQKDVREIQLAKAAVRGGVETLLLRYGVTYDQVTTVYLAGGFGFHIDTKKAIQIGMLPGEFENKIQTVGNSSLGGAIRYFISEDGDREMDCIVGLSTEINLSSDKEFNDFYMEHMFFE